MTSEQKIALYFMEQCLGGTSGHMAEIPHNPNIQAFVKAFCVSPYPDKAQFAAFLDDMSASLKAVHSKTPHEDEIPY